MHKYRLVAKKGEGTFSEVLKAQCIKNSKYVAIKCMKNHFDSLDQVNNLREIQALRRLSPHPNIIKLLEVLYDQPTGRLALVFELMDMNIYELIRGRRHYVAEERVKNYMYQLVKAMDHMHRNGIFHRDIKPENILIMDDCLKLADFGSCRGIYSKQPYTEYISTRWYRAPECLLTDGYYNYKMDMWGVGCVFFEIVSLFPLFPGTNELDQIQKIHNILGTPPPELLAKMKKRSQHMDFNFPQKEGTGIAKLIPHVSPDCTDLITKLLAYNPDDRLSARQALRHPYFKELRDAEKRQKALLTPEGGGAPASSSGAPQSTVPHMGHQEVAEIRKQLGSANGSEVESAALAALTLAAAGSDSKNNTMTPSEAGRHNTLDSSLPSINAKPHQGGGGAAAGGGGTHGGGGGGTTNLEHHEKDDVQQTDTSYKLPGLLGQPSQVSMDGMAEDGSLPPIANLSLSKANMSVNQTARRSTLGYYDQQYNKSKAAAAAALSKRQSINQVGVAGGVGGVGVGVGAGGAMAVGMPAMPGVPNKYQVSPKPAVGAPVPGPVGGHKEAANSFKYKANAAKPSGKYISPYSLRQLAAAKE